MSPKTRFGIARLGLGGDGAHFGVAESQGFHGRDQFGIFIKTRRQSHGIGESNAENLLVKARIFHRFGTRESLHQIGREVCQLQKRSGQMVRRFGVELKKEGFELFVIDHLPDFRFEMEVIISKGDLV